MSYLGKRNGISAGLVSVASLSPSPQFTPSYLFGAGEQGVWYDPSDFSTMYQDSAGTTPVTAVEQPVGLLLDKSKGLVLGAELVAPINFTTGWTSTGAVVTFDSSSTYTAASVANVYKTYFTVGLWYKIVFKATHTGGVTLYNSASGANIINSVTLVSGTEYTFYFLAVATQLNIRAAAAGSVTVSNISVKELPGNHATQATSASRPTLSARVNLLTKTEDFSDAVWTKQQVAITANATTAPDGTTTADLLTENATNDNHRVYCAAITAANTSNTLSIYAKNQSGSRFVGLRMQLNTTNYAHCIFDLSAQTFSANASVTSAAITSVGGDWYKLQMTGLGLINTGALLYMSNTASAPATTATGVSYTGDGTSGIYIWGASLVPADQASLPYQRVNTATDYDTVGFKHYLKFDGVDDSLATGSIDFTATDKMTAFAGVRKLSDAVGILAELSANALVNNGAFYFAAPEDSNNRYWSLSRGNAAGAANQAATVGALVGIAPDTAVLTVTHNIAGDLSTIRRNAVAGTNGTGDQGTGNFGNYPLFVGGRGGTTLLFNGHIYSLIARAAQSTDAQIVSAETYVNGKTGAY